MPTERTTSTQTKTICKDVGLLFQSLALTHIVGVELVILAMHAGTQILDPTSGVFVLPSVVSVVS